MRGTSSGSGSTGAGAGTAAATGEDFTLSTGSSRTFFTIPGISSGENLILQIKQAGGTDYINVGDLCTVGDQVGVVTARGDGDSTFRVNKSETDVSVAVFFD